MKCSHHQRPRGLISDVRMVMLRRVFSLKQKIKFPLRQEVRAPDNPVLTTILDSSQAEPDGPKQSHSIKRGAERITAMQGNVRDHQIISVLLAVSLLQYHEEYCEINARFAIQILCRLARSSGVPLTRFKPRKVPNQGKSTEQRDRVHQDYG